MTTALAPSKEDHLELYHNAAARTVERKEVDAGGYAADEHNT